MATMSSPHREAEEMNPDAVASSEEEEEEEEGHTDALDTSCISAPDEDHERGANCDGGGKSSDEFVSIEEGGDEDGIMSSEELKHGLDISHQAATDEVSEIDPAEVWEDHQRGAHDNAEADDQESGSSAGVCPELEAIEVEEEEELNIGDHDGSSCELVLHDNTLIQGTTVGGGGGISRRQRQASTAPPPPPPPPPARASAEKGARSSRKKREAMSRSSRPRWQ